MVTPEEKVKIASKRISNGGGVERFDVTDHAHRWAEQNHGLMLEVQNAPSHHLRYAKNVFFRDQFTSEG